MTVIRVEQLDWAGTTTITFYGSLTTSSSTNLTAGSMLTGNTVYAFYATKTMNIYTTPNNFAHATAAIYTVIPFTAGSCINSEYS